MKTESCNLLVSSEITLKAIVMESIRPRVKARNGRWVPSNFTTVRIELRAAFPGNIVVNSVNVPTGIEFLRRYDEPKAWRVTNEQAAGFQAWVATFGSDACDLVRKVMEAEGVLEIFRSAVKAHFGASNF